MSPDFRERMCGRRALVTLTVPNTLVSNTSLTTSVLGTELSGMACLGYILHPAHPPSSSKLCAARPALFTRMSMRPHTLHASLTTLRMSSSESVISRVIAWKRCLCSEASGIADAVGWFRTVAITQSPLLRTEVTKHFPSPDDVPAKS